MSAYPETRYHCDRCDVDVVMSVTNAPPHERMAGPEEWLMLRLGADPTTPPRHLCPDCGAAFLNFMGAEPRG